MGFVKRWRELDKMTSETKLQGEGNMKNLKVKPIFLLQCFCIDKIRKGLSVLAFAIGLASYAAPLPEIKVEGADAIKTYLANVSSSEKQQMHKLLKAGDKFAKLFLDGEICGCEPYEECPVVAALTEYPIVDDFLNNFCKGSEKKLLNNQTVVESYAVDTDTHLVSIAIDPNTHTAVLTYESSLVGVLVEGQSRNDNEDFIVSWDISNRGKPISVSFTFNTNTNKVIDYSKGGSNMGYYTNYRPRSLVGIIHSPGRYSAGYSEEHAKRETLFADKITADLLNYQKTHKTQKTKHKIEGEFNGR